MAGEYPAAQNPDKKRPISIIGIFWAEAIKIQAKMSGIAEEKSNFNFPEKNDTLNLVSPSINMAFLWPNFEDKMAAAKPPKMAPRPKMEAIQLPISISRVKGW